MVSFDRVPLMTGREITIEWRPEMEKSVRRSASLLMLVVLITGLGFLLVTYPGANGVDAAQVSQSTAGIEDLDIDDSASNIDWDALPTTSVTLSDEDLTITEAGTYVLTGSSTASVIVDATDLDVRLVLSGVDINSTTNAAIVVADAETVVIQLAGDTTNTLSDASSRADEEIDGVVYSSDDLLIEGDGELTITANFADGIVSKDDLSISGGTITVTSVDDGIRGKDSVVITGGTLVVNSEGDAIKSTNDSDAGKGFILVQGGTMTINTGSDGMQAEQALLVVDGTIQVESSVEGLEAPVLIINGGDITIYASDDGINASASTFVTTGLAIVINGGTLDITVGPGDTDAIDSNGDVYINGGSINLTAPTSSVDFDGTGAFNGGTLVVNGETLTELPRGMMGGRGR